MRQNMRIVDKCVIEHRDKDGKLIRRHECNSGLWHRFLVKLGLAHNCMINYGTGGIYDIVSLVSGLAAPTLYTWLGIGDGTAADTASDTDMTGTNKYRVGSITPSRANSSAALGDELVWTHTFSHANDGTLTGTWAINEVAIFNAASGTGHILLHLAGGTDYGPVDSCNWTAGDTLAVTITLKFEQGA